MRRMSSGDELGIQLLFVPFEYGGMGGGALDVYRVCERMAAIDLGLATSELATFLGSDPIRVGGTDEQKREYMTRIAKDGVLFAYGATEPEAGSDLGALKTIAEPVGEQRDRDRLPDQRRQAVDLERRRGRPLHHPRPRSRRAELVRGRCRRRGLHARPPRGQARDPAEQHRVAVPRQGLRRCRPAYRRRRRPGSRPGPAGVRLHEADGGGVRAGRRMGGARPRDRLLAQAHPGRRPALREGGLHAQADRPARRWRWRRRGRRSRRPPSAWMRARARSTSRGRSPSTSPPRRATRPPTRRSRPTAATATRTTTWSRRSGATFASPGSTRAPPRSWR